MENPELVLKYAALKEQNNAVIGSRKVPNTDVNDLVLRIRSYNPCSPCLVGVAFFIESTPPPI
jgi:hypothetical protein